MKKILLTLLAILVVTTFPIVISYSQTYDKPGNWGVFYDRIIANVEFAGGEVAGDSLLLTSTHHATKGKIRFGNNTVYDEVNNKWSIGYGTTPHGEPSKIHIKGAVDGYNIAYQATDIGTSTNAQQYAFQAVNSAGVHGGIASHGPNTSFGVASGLANGTAFYATGNVIIASSFGDFSGGAGYIEFRAGGYPDNQIRGRINPSGEWLIGYTIDQGNYRMQVNGNSYLNGVVVANNTVSAPSFNETITTTNTASLNAANNTHYFYNGSGTTWTLPALATPNVVIKIKNIGTGALTVNSNGGLNTIFTSSAVNTVNIPVGTYMEFVSNGTLWGVE